MNRNQKIIFKNILFLTPQQKEKVIQQTVQKIKEQLFVNNLSKETKKL